MSRAALGKVKMGAIAVSIVAFFGSLVAVAQASPAAIARMNNSTGPASVTQNAPVAANPFLGNRSQSNSIAPLNLPQRPQMRSIRPMVRSRGS